MSEGNLIHIRLDYEEAFDTKKSILSSQMYLLKLLRNIENYKFLKTEEFQYKQKILPKAKIPKSLRHGNEDPEKENFKVKSRNKSIEGQLSEIKRKLDNLQRKNLELI